MTDRLQARLKQLREVVPEVSVLEVSARLDQGGLLIDIREDDEIATGMPVPARRLSRGMLELQIGRHAPSSETPLYVMCAGGTRSLLAADALRGLGYRNVASVQGGYTAWLEHQLPVHVPRVLSGEERQRYGRHLKIPEIGEAGQLRLLQSRVLLVGAGGLGSPAALYLAAAGVGNLDIVDDDVVDRSNLQRQILHADARVGTKKIESARTTLLGLNPLLQLRCHDTRLNASNVERLFAGCDVVVDGTDNFSTRYLINDACVKLGLPNVHGAIFRFEGYVTVYSQRRGGPCYRCSYPKAPPAELAPSCAEAGVLGVLPGVIGTLQAVETIKLLLGLGEPLVGRVLSYDALRAEFTEYETAVNPDCPVCSLDPAQITLHDEAEVCGV
jgi:sulfur-carrier protein adenylyltransferase/sulfurtransferase